MSVLRVTYFLAALLVAFSVVGCRHGPSETDQPTPTPETEPTVVSTPERAGKILVLRDGDLHLLEGQSEHRITQSADYATGMLTRDGHVFAIRQTGKESYSFVLIEIAAGAVSTTAEHPLAHPLPDRIEPSGYLLPSPDGKDVLVFTSEFYFMVPLDGRLGVKAMPLGCCDSWSPDGSMVGYLTLAGGRQAVDERPLKFDLWVTDSRSKPSSRQVGAGLMDWFDFFGRNADSFAWWNKGSAVLALSSDEEAWIERERQLRGPVNNRLVSIDLATAEERDLLLSWDLHKRMKREAPSIEDEVVISAPATTKDGDRAAFLAMDYMRVYGVGMLETDGQLERLITVELPERELATMGAPVWSPDDTRIAYFGWRWRPSVKAFIEVFDPSTEAITRVWESAQYPKPGHWDWSPDGEWVWIIAAVRVEERHGGIRVPRDVSMLASVTHPGHVETVYGIVLDWCCAR